MAFAPHCTERFAYRFQSGCNRSNRVHVTTREKRALPDSERANVTPKDYPARSGLEQEPNLGAPQRPGRDDPIDPTACSRASAGAFDALFRMHAPSAFPSRRIGHDGWIQPRHLHDANSCAVSLLFCQQGSLFRSADLAFLQLLVGKGFNLRGAFGRTGMRCCPTRRASRETRVLLPPDVARMR